MLTKNASEEFCTQKRVPWNSFILISNALELHFTLVKCHGTAKYLDYASWNDSWTAKPNFLSSVLNLNT